MTEPAAGHECVIKKTGRSNATDAYASDCECGWSASADTVKLVKRLRHLHLATMARQGAGVTP